MKCGARYVGKAFLVAAVAAVLGWMVMVLWNAVVPGLFIGARTIDYRHALGLLVLSRILFGGFRGRGGWHRQRHWRRGEAMTPLERQQFLQSTLSGGGNGTEERR
jgi:hypothetical protein